MSTLVRIKWLLLFFSAVHNGGEESSSFPLLQTGSAFAITSMPISKRAPLLRACRWSQLLPANTFQVIRHSGRPPVLGCLPLLSFLCFVSQRRRQRRRKMLPLPCSYLFVTFVTLQWHMVSHRPSQDIPSCLLYDKFIFFNVIYSRIKLLFILYVNIA